MDIIIVIIKKINMEGLIILIQEIIILEEKINLVFMKKIINYLINLVEILQEIQEEKEIFIAAPIMQDGTYKL